MAKIYRSVVMSGDGRKTVASYDNYIDIIIDNENPVQIDTFTDLSSLSMSKNGNVLLAISNSNDCKYSINGGYTWGFVSGISGLLSLAINTDGTYGVVCNNTGVYYVNFSGNPTAPQLITGTNAYNNIRACAVSNVTESGTVNALGLNSASGIAHLLKLANITSANGGTPTLATNTDSSLSTALYNNGNGGTACVSCHVAGDSNFNDFIITVNMSKNQTLSGINNTLFLYNYPANTITYSNTKIGQNWSEVACDSTCSIVTATYNDANDEESHCYRSNDGGRTFYEVVLNKYDVSYSKYMNSQAPSSNDKLLITGAACDDSGFNISLSVGNSSFGFLIQDVIQFDDKTYIHLLKEYIAATKSSSAHQQAALSVNNLKLYPGNL